MKKLGKRSQSLKTTKNCSGDNISRWRQVLILAEGAAGVCILAQLFYGSFFAAFILSPLIVVYYGRRKGYLAKKHREKLKEGFKEALLSVKASVSGGYSAENAWYNTCDEMRELLGEAHPMTRELRDICTRMGLNENIEDILQDFAGRSGIEEVQNFCDIFKIAKRSGGNMPRIIGSSVDRISEKMDVEREIRTLTASKRLEQMIMNIIPAAICAYLRIASPGYLDAMYFNIRGITVMTACLVVYGLCFMISGRIVDIEI